MSVPLDRLYHYLADVVNHDLVIYRWAPHGSRKLEDLQHLTKYPEYQWYNNPNLFDSLSNENVTIYYHSEFPGKSTETKLDCGTEL